MGRVTESGAVATSGVEGCSSIIAESVVKRSGLGLRSVMGVGVGPGSIFVLYSSNMRERLGVRGLVNCASNLGRSCSVGSDSVDSGCSFVGLMVWCNFR